MDTGRVEARLTITMVRCDFKKRRAGYLSAANTDWNCGLTSLPKVGRIMMNIRGLILNVGTYCAPTDFGIPPAAVI